MPDAAGHNIGELTRLLRELAEEAAPVRRLFRDSRARGHKVSDRLAEVVNSLLDQVAGADDVGALLTQLDGVGELVGEAVTGVGGDPGMSASEASETLSAVGIDWSVRSLYRRAAAYDGRPCLYLVRGEGDAWDVVSGEALTQARGRLGEGVELLAGLVTERGVRAGLLCSRGRFWVFPRGGEISRKSCQEVSPR